MDLDQKLIEEIVGRILAVTPMRSGSLCSDRPLSAL
jgi:hypothetical protein